MEKPNGSVWSGLMMAFRKNTFFFKLDFISLLKIKENLWKKVVHLDLKKAVLIITEKVAESHFPSRKMEDTSPFLKRNMIKKSSIVQ